MTNRIVFSKSLPLVCEGSGPAATEWVEERNPNEYWLVKGLKQTLTNCSLGAPAIVDIATEGGPITTPVAGNQIQFNEIPITSVAEQSKINLESPDTLKNLALMKTIYETHLDSNDRRIDAIQDQIVSLADQNLSAEQLEATRKGLKSQIEALRTDTTQTEGALRQLRQFL